MVIVLAYLSTVYSKFNGRAQLEDVRVVSIRDYEDVCFSSE